MAVSPLAKARLISLFLESLTYGMYLLTCVNCWAALLRIDPGRQSGRWRRPSEIKWVTLVAAFFLFVFGTLHLSLGLHNALTAFVYSPSADSALMDIGDWVDVLSSVLVVVQCAIGDSVLIYRCYVVYDRKWMPIIPSVTLFLGSMYCTIYFIYLQITASFKFNLIVIKLLVPYSISFWALTMAQNSITTGLLIWRIGAVTRRANRLGVNPSESTTGTASTLNSVMRIIAESGLLYTLFAFATFITAVLGSTAGYPLTAMEIIVVGIAFNLIVTRTSRVRRTHGSNGNMALSDPSIAFPRPLNPISKFTNPSCGLELQSFDSKIKMDSDSGIGGIEITTSVSRTTDREREGESPPPWPYSPPSPPPQAFAV